MNKIKLTAVMFLWGSIGLFSRYIDLSPVLLAFYRAVLSIPVLLVMVKLNVKSEQIEKTSVLLYALSGILIGLAWLALFYGYKYTSISSAVIIYNMCPIYVMLAAPFILKEKLSVLHICIIFVSFIGLILIVGMVEFNRSNVFGMALSGVSGVLYAVIVLINRKIKVKLESTIATLIQMIAAVLALIPFVLLEDNASDFFLLDIRGILLTIILGVVHTGFAYSLYFSTYHQLKSIEIVSYSYLEPVFGIILSMLFVGEVLRIEQFIGGVLILGSTYLGEYIKSKTLMVSVK